MNYSDFIENAINNAKRNISSIPQESPVLDHKALDGMSRSKGRHLLNNLCEYGNTFMEIGSHKGSTFISALYAHKKEHCYSIDNWSQFGNHNDEFLSNVKNFLPNVNDKNLTYFNIDCWSLDLEKIKHKIDFYFYDGAHDFESQKKALTHFYPILNDIFLLCVDDYFFRGHIQAGTQAGIKECNLEILNEGFVKSRSPKPFWNGYYVAFLKKTD